MHKIRQKVEREIVGRFVRDALAAGYRLSVSLERGYDIDTMLLGSRDESAIMGEAFAGDEAHIFVHSAKGNLVHEYPDRLLAPTRTLNPIGWVFIVLGNSGWDVISDYSTSLERLMSGANSVSEEYQ